MDKLILSIDQSTSATKAILFDADGRLLQRCNRDHRQFYPNPGWVEHDPEEIMSNVYGVIRDVLAASGVDESRIAALAVTNQRETSLVWNRHTGKPIYNALVWQCQRAHAICRTLEEAGHAPMVRERTGLVLSPYFSAAKIKWVLDNVPGARESAERGDLMCGTIDTWLIWNLTGRTVFATDPSNASRTQLLNLKTQEWDPELLRIFTIPASMMPQVRHSDALFGSTVPGLPFRSAVPISGVMGDSHAALFGQACFSKGMAKTTYGTGSSIMMNIGTEPLPSQKGLVTSIAWGRRGAVEYVLEGNINCTGATVKWLVDDLELISSSKESGVLAASIPDNGGVYIVPAFVGLGAPYWDSEARASITGLTRGSKKAHVVRAAEESIAYQIRDVIDLMVEESGAELRELRVDGGATRDRFLMQFQTDMLGRDVACASIEELSAFGACLMAGSAVGLWQTDEDLAALRHAGDHYSPSMDPSLRAALYDGWKAAVARTLTRR